MNTLYRSVCAALCAAGCRDGNIAASQLDLDRAGGYIARRLVQTGDLEGLAWGATNLRPDDWRHAAHARGIDERQRALAINLAEAR